MKNKLVLRGFFIYAFLAGMPIHLFASEPNGEGNRQLLVKPALVEEYGRLFTYPATRRYLDKNRSSKITNESAVSIKSGPVNADAVQTQSRKVKLSGYVLREDGQHMVWLNGNSELSNQNDSDYRASKPSTRRKSVYVHANKKSTLLKPGQVWLLDSQEIEESYLMDETNAAGAATDVSTPNTDIDNESLSQIGTESPSEAPAETQAVDELAP